MGKSATNKDFENIYTSNYSRLKRFATEYVLLEEDAENIVHDVFAELWERWPQLSGHFNLFAYLFLSTKNRCLDFIRRRNTAQKIINNITEEYYTTLRANEYALEEFNKNLFSEEDIETIIENAINTLPEKCREIFIKSKIEGKKHQQIAQELDISINTIESQMGIAYKKLRIELKKLLPLFIFLIS